MPRTGTPGIEWEPTDVFKWSLVGSFGGVFFLCWVAFFWCISNPSRGGAGGEEEGGLITKSEPLTRGKKEDQELRCFNCFAVVHDVESKFCGSCGVELRRFVKVRPANKEEGGGCTHAGPGAHARGFPPPPARRSWTRRPRR